MIILAAGGTPAAEVIEKKTFKIHFCKFLLIKKLHFSNERPSNPEIARFGPSGSVLGQSYRKSDRKTDAD